MKYQRFSYAETIAVPHGKSYSPYTEKLTQTVFRLFWTLIPALFGAKRKIMRAGHHHPETLLAGMDTAFAELVIPASDVLAQEERPFQTPFFAPAHKSPISGKGLFGAFHNPHPHFASSSRSRMEGFFSGGVLCTSAWTFSCFSPRPPLLIISSIIP